MKHYITGLVLFASISLSNIGMAQSTYKIQDTRNVEMKLSGTSTFHDWEMDANSATGEAQFIFQAEGDNKLTALESLSFALKVKDLKSDSEALDENAYEALKSDQYKEIHYKLTSATPFPEANGYLVKSRGQLTVAGVTKNIDMDVHCVVNPNGTITCHGTHHLKMTDYQVDPPSFMWGAMKTGDALTLDFKVTYVKQ